MGKYSPGSGPYEVRYGMLSPTDIPESFQMAKHVHQDNEKKYGFYSRLEQSVRREGFRNPILLWEKPNERTIPYGGSRAWTAINLQVPVPCIACDWAGTWRAWELLTDCQQVLAKFSDRPTVIEFTEELFHFWGCAQTQLEEADRKFFTERQRKNDITHVYNNGKVLRGNQVILDAWYARNYFEAVEAQRQRYCEKYGKPYIHRERNAQIRNLDGDAVLYRSGDEGKLRPNQEQGVDSPQTPKGQDVQPES
ncbi:MAG: hypothetical protein ACE5LB_13350 [Acidiferrobacterales bacterium]